MKISSKNNSPRYIRDGITSYLLAAESTTDAKHITTSLVEMLPSGKQHIHQHVTEQCYFIVRGKGEMIVGKEKRRVRSGDSIFIPSNSPHGLTNNNKDTLVYLSAGSPPFGKESEKELWPLPPLEENGCARKDRIRGLKKFRGRMDLNIDLGKLRKRT